MTNSEELLQEIIEYESQHIEKVLNNLKIKEPMFYQYLGVLQEKANKYDELTKEAQDEEV
ncbi:hypothetical protein NF716_00900 [Lactococcus formosensis]|uniref:hypothetical protein n=1 Tax=Lactococcus formosensis TaxID=1281486 RepID=UPI002435BB8B|nr:hypothetical protein [Lactococcus formosensis]MDG6154921.1 hypothetical protein [Lactococcus formosensis]